jgi:hypothetical protein
MVMKYWTELNRLETQIIRLETMRSLFSVLASGAEESSEEDIRNALWYVEGSLTDIHRELRSDFDDLWEVVKYADEEDVEKEEKKHKGGMKKKKKMTDRELP